MTMLLSYQGVKSCNFQAKRLLILVSIWKFFTTMTYSIIPNILYNNNVNAREIIVCLLMNRTVAMWLFIVYKFVRLVFHKFIFIASLLFLYTNNVSFVRLF